MSNVCLLDFSWIKVISQMEYKFIIHIIARYSGCDWSVSINKQSHLFVIIIIICINALKWLIKLQFTKHELVLERIIKFDDDLNNLFILQFIKDIKTNLIEKLANKCEENSTNFQVSTGNVTN